MKVGKLDGDKNPSMIERFNIQGYPSIFLFGSGIGEKEKEVMHYPGTFKKEDILQYVED